jgi:hypothetical protein
MKTIIFATSLLVLTASAMAANVGVSINVAQPGLYGQINIGEAPRPTVVYARPVMIERPVHYVEQEPVYLHVPPGHSKHWSQHCREYNACGKQVYFVQDSWYNKEYAPRHREQHGDRDHHDNDHHDHDRNDERNDHEGHGHSHNRG